MAFNLIQVVSNSAFKTQRQYFPVALTTASDRQGGRECRFLITPRMACSRAMPKFGKQTMYILIVIQIEVVI